MEKKIRRESVHWMWCAISGVLNALTILQYIKIIFNYYYEIKKSSTNINVFSWINKNNDINLFIFKKEST
jgi:hypothetical protein